VHPLSHILDTLAKGAGVRPAGALDYQARESKGEEAHWRESDKPGSKCTRQLSVLEEHHTDYYRHRTCI